jgi:TctA family transporter
MLLSRGDLMVFLNRPISAWFIGACCLLILAQLIAYARKVRLTPKLPEPTELVAE